MIPVRIDELVHEGEVYLKIAPQAIVLPITCPHCEHKWDTHFWLEDFIVDKPNNLLEKSLWFVSCPNCKDNLKGETLRARISVEVEQV